MGGEHELRLHKLAVDVTTRPGMVRSHLSLEVATPNDGQSEAVIRLPVPRGAAVTDAVLWVNDKPMRGAFVERQRARDIYTSIVTRRRDPALVAWDGPGWLAVSIFPLEKNRPRRFELDWVEPAAEADGLVQYRVPIVAERDRIVGRASIKVDGHKLAGHASDLIANRAGRPAPGGHAAGAGRSVPSGDGPRGGTDGRAAFRPARGDVRRDDDRPSRAPALDARRHVQRAAARREGDHAVRRLDVSPIVEDVGAAGWPEALEKIDAIPSAGGLHLERALTEAAEHARRTGAGAVLFVGLGQDGFAGDGVAAPLGLFRTTGVRFSVVVVDAGEVPSPLVHATAETGGEAIPLRAFDESLPFLADALRPRHGHPALDARGEGEWHVLRTVTGGAVWIGRALDAEIPADAQTARADAGSPLAIDLASLWERARLEWHDRDAADEIPKVLTPVTSLLVLETEQDYRRFGLDVPQPVAVEQGRRHAPQGRGGKMGKRPPRAGRALRPPRAARQPDPQLAAAESRRATRHPGRPQAVGGLTRRVDLRP
jgi:hypothetical protein